MRLKELEIQGFKSFPDKTKITIGEGITGVVGPNGSGKSNISDSIRWVLGETSSKQLRGSGKMEDVIFGGTQSRGAMGFASVALTIDNSDHGLDMDADEVTIGRRYYRSGESEYSINGQNVRLKDVYELLLDTGIGRDGYAIVGQGRIAEIVGAKSAERREIFEEASGIAKYRYRKNEAERRLEAAEGNLERLRDILGELEKRVGPLKRDSEKAQQFLELSERRKSLEVTLWVDAIRRANDTVRDQQRKFEAAQADYERLSRQLDEFDEKSAALREEAQQLVLQVEQANADIRAVTEANAGTGQTLRAIREAESYDGPSIVICYCPCIEHGMKASMGLSQLEEKKAVECGYWHLYRYDPRLKAEGKNPFTLDSKAPTGDFQQFLLGENRYASLKLSFPEKAQELYEKAARDARERYESYLHLAEG